MDLQYRRQRADSRRQYDCHRCAHGCYRFGDGSGPRTLAATASERGLALIEAVIAIAIIAIVAVTLTAQVSQANLQSGLGMTQTEAAAIAEAYLSEVIARPFVDPDGVDGEPQRRLFDDVDDYHGLIDNGARDASGNALPGSARFRVAVSVLRNGSLPGVPAADALLANVQVTDAAGADVRVSGLKLRP
jgi:MSHA pilin protein MshD